MTRIVINQSYIHENDLVKVIGMSIKSNPANTTFLIEWFTWADGKDERHTKEVSRRELETAPTLERLYGDYKACLDVICQQANKIEELEGRNQWDLSKDQKLSDLLKDYIAAHTERAFLTMFKIRSDIIETLSSK